jgi:hypothetical protein
MWTFLSLRVVAEAVVIVTVLAVVRVVIEHLRELQVVELLPNHN